MPQIQTPPYVITARVREGVVQQTRTRAASAIVLARTWQEAGYTSIEVVDSMGNLLTPERYRNDRLREARGLYR